MNTRDSVLQTVFKKNINQSFLQINHNKINKKESNHQDILEQESYIEKNVNEKTARLTRNFNYTKTMLTLKKQGIMYTKPNNESMWACFTCSSRQGKRVSIENRIISIKDGTGRILETINCDTVSIRIEKGNKFIKLITRADKQTNEKTFYFQATPQENLKQWQQSLQRSINGSEGSKHQLRYLTTIPEYYNTLSISQKDFTKKCNSGDILLFKSTHGTAKLQRGITQSQYDHIAMILKNQKNEVLIFESSSESGVALTFWKDMVKYSWYDATQRITYRELKIDRTNDFLSKIEVFTIQNIDKKFQCGLGKLLTLKSVVKTKQQQKGRTYFCSQLIAKCYKQAGLLPFEKSSTQYWPVDFTQDGTLNLLKGQLGPEQLICFDKQLCNSY